MIESDESREILMKKIAEIIETYETMMECTIGCEVSFTDANMQSLDSKDMINYSYNGQSFVICDKE